MVHWRMRDTLGIEGKENALFACGSNKCNVPTDSGRMEIAKWYYTTQSYNLSSFM
jgi:hypothetical protein